MPRLDEFLDALPTDRRKPSGRGTATGNATFRGDLQQGYEYERPQMHARVRQTQAVAIDDPIIVKQQVQVQRPRSKPVFTPSAESALDIEQGIEQG